MFSILGVEVHLAKQKDAKHLIVNGLKCEDPFNNLLTLIRTCRHMSLVVCACYIILHGDINAMYNE